MTTATEGLPDTSPLEKVRRLGCAADTSGEQEDCGSDC